VIDIESNPALAAKTKTNALLGMVGAATGTQSKQLEAQFNEVASSNAQLEAQNKAMKEGSQLIMEERDKLKMELKKVMTMYIELANIPTRESSTQYEEDDEIDFGDNEEEAARRKALFEAGDLTGLVEVMARQDEMLIKAKAEMDELLRETASLRRRNAEANQKA